MLSLTRQERQVVLFFVSVALVGIGLDFLAKRYSKAQVAINNYQDIGKIDLNSADKELLISVSGIGEKLAGRIIEYRQRNGCFQELEELKNIKGISDYRYEKIKDSFILK